MDGIAQKDALAADRLSDRDRVAFWRDPRWDDLECLHATFVQHEYAPHTHDTFVIGVIESGVELYRLNGVSQCAVAGDVCVVNPGELHDGSPGENGYRYRMFYPSAALLSGIREEVTDKPDTGSLHFRQAIYDDTDVFRLLSGAHRAMERAPSHLERDSAFLEAAALLIRRHGASVGGLIAVGREADAIRCVRDYIEDNLDEDLDLAALAGLIGVSRYRLIRSFQKETGLTPHAWVTNRRLARAKRMLAAGESPAETATACGFFDQAHLTRHFKRTTGVTPAKYRCAFLQ